MLLRQSRSLRVAYVLWLGLLFCLQGRLVDRLCRVYPRLVPRMPLARVPSWLVLHLLLCRARDVKASAERAGDSRNTHLSAPERRLIVPWGTITWILWLLFLVDFLILFGAEALTGRRPDRQEPSGWRSRLISALSCMLILAGIAFGAWRGPQSWMDEPVMTLLLSCFVLVSFWPWLTLLRGRHRNRRMDGAMTSRGT